MKKHAVVSSRAPRTLGPYSQAIRCGGLVFLSGQLGIDPVSGMLAEGGVRNQTRQALDNLAAVLEAAGSRMDLLLKTTVYLRDMAHFQAVNDVYAERVGQPYPARAAVAVRELPLGAEVEIEAVAAAEA
ncbi:MAG: RidA family protein [Candidatus Aminicenantes bacterium]|nr:RidA family protein [Candidatus Aminicenantes bacterium]